MRGLLTNLMCKLNPPEPALCQLGEPDLRDLVNQARKEWVSARSYFENVSDPELVDHAIHLVTAAEKKYMYLLRRARNVRAGT